MVLPKVSLQFAKATEFPCLGGARVRCERMPLCVGEASESMIIVLSCAADHPAFERHQQASLAVVPL